MPAKQKAVAPTPEQFLDTYPPDIQALANRLRTLVKQTVPGVSEAVYTGWQLIGYRVKVKGRDAYFGFVAPTPERVWLGFEYGVLLSDPDQLLEGDGKQVRTVSIAKPEDIRQEALAALIAEAAQVAALSREEKARLLLEREAERELSDLLKRCCEE